MKGKLVGAKFPRGTYFCKVAGANEAVSGNGKTVLVVTYEVLEGNRKGQGFRERVRVTEKFLEALGQPHEYGSDWDTNAWIGRELWVEVDYSKDSNEWPRFRHSEGDPRSPEERGAVKGQEDTEIPF